MTQSSAARPPLVSPRTSSEGSPRTLDPWVELEGLVDRLARLVLNTEALAERMALSGRAEASLARLRTGAERARQALVAAARLPVP